MWGLLTYSYEGFTAWDHGMVGINVQWTSPLVCVTTESESA